MTRRYVFLIVGLALVAILFRVGMAADVTQDSTFRALLIPVATVVLDSFNSSGFAIALCFGMALVALILFAYYALFRVGPVLKDIRSVNEELRSIPSGAGSLDRVSKVMARHSLVSRGWTLYRPHLVTRADGGAYASAFPERYFGMRMIEHAGLRLRFFLGLPNDFVGMGLIFTFMGLVAGLYFASRSMMSPDLGAAREALVQLLHAATFKFLTSITGIGLSLLLSWGQGSVVGQLQQELQELGLLIEERFPVRPEQGSITEPKHGDPAGGRAHTPELLERA